MEFNWTNWIYGIIPTTTIKTALLSSSSSTQINKYLITKKIIKKRLRSSSASSSSDHNNFGIFNIVTLLLLLAHWNYVEAMISGTGDVGDGGASATTTAMSSGDLNNITQTTYSTDCGKEFGCLRCNWKGCIKCVHLIMADDRQCVSECPRGYFEQWSYVPDLMGRVCRPSGYSDPMLATIVGLTVGATLCLILLVSGVLMVKRKQRQAFARNSLIDDTIEREDFLKQLEDLRPNAEYFLAMLNDTRRQIRKLFLAGDQAGANSYRTIVRDLAKILILLNRPIELIGKPPQDWNRVYAWALRVMDRYKPQIAQLIDFLQTPHDQLLNDPRLGSSQYSTFKSTNTASTTAACISNSTTNTMSMNDMNQKNIHQMQIFGSLISLHEIDDQNNEHHQHQQPQQTQTPRRSSTNPFRSSCSTLKSNSNYPSSDIHGSSLWLEDEFFKLGFRPQDEITTEL